MVWQKLFPSQGGGGVRRWIRIRQDLYNNYMNQSSTSSTTKIQKSSSSDAMEHFRNIPMKPLTIVDFRNFDDAADARAVDFGATKGGWRVSDDETIGGYSRGKLELIENANTDDAKNVDDDKQEQQQHEYVKQPFVRWTGNIDTRIGPKSRAKRSGFCAIRCPEFPFGIPLGSRYNALEINCRTDGRIYTVNLKASSYFPDDLYQALITVDPMEVQNQEQQNDTTSEFLTLVLPFTDFALTSGGLVRATQRELDGAIKLDHLGFALMDGLDGPFQFDLARIRAVNYRDGMIIGDDDDNNDGNANNEE